MFERFTDRSRRVVVLAQNEARELGHNYIGTEHLLLGILDQDSGNAHEALCAMNVDLGAVREDVLSTIGRGDNPPHGHIPFTPRAKKVLELALRECQHLRHSYIGTEHLLLSLIREGDGVAAQVLGRHGVTLDRARAQVAVLAPPGSPREELNITGAHGIRMNIPFDEIREQLSEISDRLAAIERKLGIGRGPAAEGDEQAG